MGEDGIAFTALITVALKPWVISALKHCIISGVSILLTIPGGLSGKVEVEGEGERRAMNIRVLLALVVSFGNSLIYFSK